MALLMKGVPVAEELDRVTKEQVTALRASGTIPTLAILRCGAREDGNAYERSVIRRCEKLGIEVLSITLPEKTGDAAFFKALSDLNANRGVHGILTLRPLPEQIDGERARREILPEKDVDGCTDGSLAGLLTGAPGTFAPCTAQAVMEVLRYYRIPLDGRRAAVVGRSLVVGKPAALLLLQANATVTVCHSHTEGLAAILREADIVVTATGRAESIGADHLREEQVVIDVGTSWSEKKNKLCGDIRFDEAEPLAAALTPVPGGVGAVTTSVLCRHVAEAAERA